MRSPDRNTAPTEGLQKSVGQLATFGVKKETFGRIGELVRRPAHNLNW
jgi:hypothetical protein